MVTSEHSEARKYRRFEVDWPVMIDHRRFEHAARTLDVSVSGVRLFHNDLDLAVGSLCFFRIHARGEWVALSGKIVERGDIWMRIELYGVGRYDQELWMQTIQQLSLS